MDNSQDKSKCLDSNKQKQLEECECLAEGAECGEECHKDSAVATGEDGEKKCCDKTTNESGGKNTTAAVANDGQ